MDLESHRRWYDHSRAREALFLITDTPESPWYVVQADEKRRARLNCIAHLLPSDSLPGSARRPHYLTKTGPAVRVHRASARLSLCPRCLLNGTGSSTRPSRNVWPLLLRGDQAEALEALHTLPSLLVPDAMWKSCWSASQPGSRTYLKDALDAAFPALQHVLIGFERIPSRNERMHWFRPTMRKGA